MRSRHRQPPAAAEPTDPTKPAPSNPDIPDKQWTNPFLPGTPLHNLFDRRIRQGRDLVIIIDDYHAGRGTGKTIASLQLANGMDQNGGLEFDQVSMNAEEIRAAYAGQDQRSGIVLDEGEVSASNRQAMSKVNQALREIMSMGRVEEKYVVINAPSIGFIDKDVRMLADVWITMIARGIGLVHFLKRQPYARQLGGQLLTEKKQLIEFRDVEKGSDLRSVYNKLTREKRKLIAGEDGGGFVPQDEHNKIVEREVKQALQDQRNEHIEKIAEHPKLDGPQSAIADVVELSAPRVNQILKEEGDA